ncbi:MAG: rRNA maturation RNase YbeY [Candidatus Moranbacteria bacterium]|nr:rRNA maturation RNase YbeY [Candidatus Moranbacteria bacterium]
MKFILEINNKTAQKFSKKKFLGVFARTLELAKLQCLENKTLELSVALVAEDEIQTLNTQYRQKKKPTDVLSFCEYESVKDLCNEKQEHVFLGELIVCPEYIRKNAQEDGESLEYALTYIVSHGILHLLGFDHGKKMFDLQRKVADDLAV